MKKLYKFYKNDCAPCYSLGRKLIQIENEIPKEIEIINMNVANEENKSFAKSFGIDKVPALLHENGKTMIGGDYTKEQVLEFIVGGIE